MEETIDFSGANLDDFKFGETQQQEPTSAPETTPEVSATTETPTQVEPEQVQTPEPSPEPVADKPAETAYDFKDDFIKGVVEFYEKTGDLTAYLQAKTVDFNQMSDEEVMRRNLREQYSDLSDKAFDRLFKQEVTDKFKLDADEWGEEDSELGRELLKVQASKLRGQYLDWQKNFSAPEPKVDEEQLRIQEETQRTLQQFEEQVRNNELTKNILEGNKLTIKTAEGEFNYELQNASSLLDMTIDNDKFFSQFASDNGQLDYAKWYKTAAYSQNPEMFEKSLINYGKTLGRSEVTKEIKNPSTAPVGDVPTESSGDFTSGLLQAFLNRGISK
jgi:hypothetical protein